MTHRLAVLGVAMILTTAAAVSCGSPTRDLLSEEAGAAGNGGGSASDQAGDAGKGAQSGARATGAAGTTAGGGKEVQSYGGETAQAGPGGAGGTGAGGAGAGGASAGGEVDTAGLGGDPGDAGGSGVSTSCNAVAEQGTAVDSQSFPNSSLPDGTGGTIVAGTYVLTNFEWFMTSISVNVAGTISISVQDSVATLQGVFDGLDTTARYTGTLATTNPGTEVYICEDQVPAALLPLPNMPSSADYTATANTLMLMFPDPESPGGGHRLTFSKK